MYSAIMAPQTGPKDAPMNPKIEPASKPQPIRQMPIAAKVHKPTEINGGIFDSVDLRLAIPIKEETQAAGNAEITSKTLHTKATLGPHKALIMATGLFPVMPGSPAPYAPATVKIAAAPAIKVATKIPKNPPQITSDLLRAFEEMSTPAAPAVAKNPVI